MGPPSAPLRPHSQERSPRAPFSALLLHESLAHRSSVTDLPSLRHESEGARHPQVASSSGDADAAIQGMLLETQGSLEGSPGLLFRPAPLSRAGGSAPQVHPMLSLASERLYVWSVQRLLQNLGGGCSRWCLRALPGVILRMPVSREDGTSV